MTFWVLSSEEIDYNEVLGVYSSRDKMKEDAAKLYPHAKYEEMIGADVWRCSGVRIVGEPFLVDKPVGFNKPLRA